MVTLYGSSYVTCHDKRSVHLHQYFSHSMCAVPSVAIFCSSLMTCFSGMLFKYFLNDFRWFPVALTMTGITFVYIPRALDFYCKVCIF